MGSGDSEVHQGINPIPGADTEGGHRADSIPYGPGRAGSGRSRGGQLPEPRDTTGTRHRAQLGTARTLPCAHPGSTFPGSRGRAGSRAGSSNPPDVLQELVELKEGNLRVPGQGTGQEGSGGEGLLPTAPGSPGWMLWNLRHPHLHCAPGRPSLRISAITMFRSSSLIFSSTTFSGIRSGAEAQGVQGLGGPVGWVLQPLLQGGDGSHHLPPQVWNHGTVCV